MNKMTHLKFNLNNFLFALSDSLDIIHPSNLHQIPFSSKRIAYMALKIAKLNLMEEDFISDLLSFCLIAHNQRLKSNIDKIPFNNLENITNPHMTKLISLCSFVELQINIQNNFITNKQEVIDFIECKDCFDEVYLENILYLMEYDSFWFDLTNTQTLPFKILDMINDFTFEYEYTKLIDLSKLFYQIYYEYTNRQQVSDIGLKLLNLCKHYNFDQKDTSRMVISGYLAYLGFLHIPIKILEEDSTNKNELFKTIPYINKEIISRVFGFDDIADISSSINENIDSSGYPYKKSAGELSLKLRLFTILYRLQALEETRTYRKSYTNNEVFEILKKEAQDGLLDSTILKDIESLMHN
jgi:hypothetical protein